VLITGGSGIAAATARLAAAEGAQVFLAGLSAEEGLKLYFHLADLTIPDAAAGAVNACLERYGRIDALFNVAGISGRKFGDGPLHECTEEGWDRTMTTNVKSMFLVSRAVLQHMLTRALGGAIVNMSSVLAFSPEPKHFAAHAYAASKGAIVSMTRAMASYYAPHKIRVNCIAPGLVRTPMSRRAQEDPTVLAYIRAKQPLAEDLLGAEEIAHAAVFLLSDEARMITGQVVTVDGGWSVSGT